MRTPALHLHSLLLTTALGALASGAACAKPPAPSLPTSSATVAPATQSTIDPRLQAIADEELERMVREWQPAAATVLALDARTGEVRADAGRAHGAAADVASKNAYFTGSTIKAVTIAAALEEGVLSPADRIDCEQGSWTYDGKVLHDADPHGTLSVSEIVATSSNVGVAKIFDRLGGERLGRWLRAFHFGAAPHVADANAGEVPSRIEDKSYAGALAAIGLGVKASPLQVAAAYVAIANGGSYVEPTFTRRATDAPREQILKPDTARALARMLDEAVNGENAHGKLARIPGRRVAGKTGTASWDRPDGSQGIYASFVGFVPSASPPLVILVGAEQPRSDEGGGTVTAPVFARVASRALGDASGAR